MPVEKTDIEVVMVSSHGLALMLVPYPPPKTFRIYSVPKLRVEGRDPMRPTGRMRVYKWVDDKTYVEIES